MPGNECTLGRNCAKVRSRKKSLEERGAQEPHKNQVLVLLEGHTHDAQGRDAGKATPKKERALRSNLKQETYEEGEALSSEKNSPTPSSCFRQIKSRPASSKRGKRVPGKSRKETLQEEIRRDHQKGEPLNQEEREMHFVL